ncbi:MAG TPA: hypothetical protein VNK91_13615 [Burkholderiaceae bacterium]|jgi:uncharacterized membrane protein|nr:hypothetical protein [Burkholderiaceae bacterium]
MNARETTAPAALQLDRGRLWQVAAVLAVAVSLHVIPQWLAAWIDPALSMIALMVIDALVFALVVRSVGSLKVTGVLALIFVAVLYSRQQHLVALPSIVLNLACAAAFALTLAPGRTPLIHAIAAHAIGRDAIDAAFARYLRGVTAAWAIFFLLMAAASAVLALAAPFDWWSLFVNVLSWPLIGLMFVVEYGYRRWRHPQLPAHTPLQTIASALAFPARTAHRAFESR